MPSTLHVTTNLDSGPGSLRAEITAAKNNDTIVFAPRLDGQSITLSSGELQITKNLTIRGPGAGLLTISGGGSSRVFEVDGAGTIVTLNGLTISNGDGIAGGSAQPSDGLGGGILNYGNLTISACTLSGDSASFTGGGIDNEDALTVSGCTLSGNSASGNGGGIRN